MIDLPSREVRGKMVAGTQSSKLCPRCSGRMFLETDNHGTFFTCLPCGYIHENKIISPENAIREASAKSGRPPRRRQPSHGRLRL